MVRKYFLFGLTIAFISGCATTELPSSVSTSPTTTDVISATSSTPKKGVYHKVQKGVTIWRIAQAYQVDLDEIIKSNNIPNVANVEENQLLFIPGVDAVKEIPPAQQDINKGEFIWPVKGKVVSFFGERRGSQFNRGIGIQANVADDVLASREGKVVFSDFLTGYAKTIILDHEDGYYSVYGQNSELLAKLGDRVFKGSPIAKVGRRDSLPYLYFEIRKHAMADNPLYYLP